MKTAEANFRLGPYFFTKIEDCSTSISTSDLLKG